MREPATPRLVTCRICGKEFWTTHQTKSTCSKECSHELKIEMDRLRTLKKAEAKKRNKSHNFANFEHFQKWATTLATPEIIAKYSWRYE